MASRSDAASGGVGLTLPSARSAGGALAVVAAVILLAAPAFLDAYWMRVITYALMFAGMSAALNITAGFIGYPAFGDVVWFGLGATVTGTLMVTASWPFAAAVPVAVLVCAVIAALVGPPLLRLRGHYFAIGTLALNFATLAVVRNLEVTGGSLGLALPLAEGSVESTGRLFYYLFLGAMTLTILVSVVVMRTRLGFGLRSIRANEEAAEAAGVNTTLLKTIAWTLSAVLIGLAGAIYAYWISYIEPPAVFNVAISIKMFVIVLLGGVGTVFGPVIGAFAIQLLEATVWGGFLGYNLLILGSILMLTALFLPRGVVAFARERIRALRVRVGR
jgi:branched-chain amino acid transport system permease protein